MGLTSKNALRVTVGNVDGDVYETYTEQPDGTWLDSSDEEVATDIREFNKFFGGSTIGASELAGAERWARAQ